MSINPQRTYLDPNKIPSSQFIFFNCLFQFHYLLVIRRYGFASCKKTPHTTAAKHHPQTGLLLAHAVAGRAESLVHSGGTAAGADWVALLRSLRVAFYCGDKFEQADVRVRDGRELNDGPFTWLILI